LLLGECCDGHIPGGVGVMQAEGEPDWIAQTRLLLFVASRCQKPHSWGAREGL
jgi:hypothetical protein